MTWTRRLKKQFVWNGWQYEILKDMKICNNIPSLLLTRYFSWHYICNSDLDYCLMFFESNIITNTSKSTKQSVNCYMKYCRCWHFTYKDKCLYFSLGEMLFNKMYFFCLEWIFLFDEISCPLNYPNHIQQS